MRRLVTRGDVLALALGAAALLGSMALLQKVRRGTDPRPYIVSAIRREATARDLLVVTDESPELLAAMHPYPAIWGTPPMPDLTGVRRLHMAVVQVILATRPTLRGRPDDPSVARFISTIFAID